jgi:hypothetical protein
MRPSLGTVVSGAMLGWCAAAGPALAWGPEAHRATAMIAERILQQGDPATLKKLTALLATDKSKQTKNDIAGEATWVDVLRDKSEEARLATAGWHATRLKPDNPDAGAACYNHRPLPEGYPASRGPHENCSIDKVEQFRAELASPETTSFERLAAARYLLNLVPDLHDPLLAIDKGDQGGACTAIQIGTKPPVRLSTYWESTLVTQAIAGNAAKLAPGPEGKPWIAGTPEGWVRDTFDVAKTVAYNFGAGAAPEKYEFPAAAKGQPAITCPSASLYKVAPDYETKAEAAVRQQLAKAGTRLAAILSANLK